MDINHRKTALDDDASLYNKKHDVVTKEDLKNLSKKDKLRYFKDYYSKKVIVVLIIIIGIIMVLNEAVFNRKNCLLQIACLNEYQIENSEELAETLEELLNIENKNDYANVSYYDTDEYNMNMAYVTHTATGSIDLLICSEEQFETSANRGMLVDLSEFLPADMYEQLSDRILESRTSDEDYDTGAITYGEYQPFGIDLSGSEVYKEYGGYGDAPILCVMINATNTDNALTGIKYLTGIE